MNELLFQPATVSSLALFILNVVVLGYLLSVRRKSRATWWLAAAFLGFSFYFLGGIISTSWRITGQPIVGQITGLSFFLGTGIGIWALLHFAYRFLENPFPREARIAIWVTGLLLALDIGHAVIVIFFSGELDTPDIFHSPLLLCFILWATVVLLRKRRHALHDADSGAQQRAARAYRAYALLNGLIILFLAYQSLFVVAGYMPQGWILTLVFMILLSFFLGLAVVYINHAPEPTTLQAKLVGLTLVTAMALLVVVTELLYPINQVESARIDPPEQEALRFIPDDAGGYEVARPVIPYGESDIGENLSLGDDTTKTVAFGFAFPFAGQGWDSLFVSPNGIVTFGAPIYQSNRVQYSSDYFYTPLPKIAPLYIDLDASAGGGVYLKRTPAQVIITWNNVPQFGREKTSNNFQLVLDRSGSVTFIYDRLETVMNGMRGLLPAGASRATARSQSTPTAPARLAAGAAWFTHYNLSHRLNVHNEVKDLVWLTLGAALFILLIFPFFFRSSLIQPLGRLRRGVQQVNAGDLETEIPVGVRDEIGYLTHHFNRMTQSLRRYSEEMEEQVAERTAKLQASLEELQAAQTQLVQQEKLASLGQLTAGIAHEIKNPLNFVNNFSDVSIELIEEARQELSAISPQSSGALAILNDIEANLLKIHEHGSRADGIVKSMLQHSRGGSGKIEQTDLNDLIKEYVNLAFHGMRAGKNPINVDIELNLDDNVEEVPLIAEDFSRVIVNLCNNAFDAMREKQDAGESGQDAENYEPKLRAQTKQGNDQVIIEIEDNGQGIPKELKDRILQPFFTTKKGTEGTGLGLSITHDILKAHGALLEIESRPGSFAKFIIKIPTQTN